MGIADMFLIGSIFGHGKSLLITHQQGQAGLSTAGVAHSLAVDWFGWVCYFCNGNCRFNSCDYIQWCFIMREIPKIKIAAIPVY